MGKGNYINDYTAAILTLTTIIEQYRKLISISPSIAANKMSGQKDAFPAGGDLSEMAATGTTVPEDSAKPRIIPSVAKPGQGLDTASDPNDLGASDLASAADNASDIPRVSFHK